MHVSAGDECDASAARQQLLASAHVGLPYQALSPSSSRSASKAPHASFGWEEVQPRDALRYCDQVRRARRALPGLVRDLCESDEDLLFALGTFAIRPVASRREALGEHSLDRDLQQGRQCRPLPTESQSTWTDLSCSSSPMRCLESF
jgi:hypothetical protein